MGLAETILSVMVLGLVAQWVAWILRIPAIVVLIVTGFVAGPVLGFLDFGDTGESFTHLIGLGVAVILFEGGMNLEFREFRRVGTGVRRLVIFGAPIAWILGTLAGHFVGGLSWSVSAVMGGILVVTGPTVIQPLLKQASLNQDTASLFKWEGIINDPIGAIIAVLTYQYVIYAGEGSGLLATLSSLGLAVLAAIVLGVGGGWVTSKLFTRGSVPEHLKAPLLLVIALLVYEVSNLTVKEAGLLTVTVFGIVLGNSSMAGVDELRRFKEHLSVLLISVLFIVLTANLSLSDLALIDWRAAALFVAILFVVRPLTIALAMLNSSVRWQNRVMLGWIAPRGIVAAATAGLFGPGLVEAGYLDGDKLMPIVFGVIVVTVILHGFTMGMLARRLGLAAESDIGVLIIGASAWTTELAKVLERENINVVLVDGVWSQLREARLAGVEVYYGEILSEHAEDWVETHHLDTVLAATPNDSYNALVCTALAPEFGQHRVFQLALKTSSDEHSRQLDRNQRGHIAFSSADNYSVLNQHLREDWKIQRTPITDVYTFENFKQDVGEEWMLVGAIGEDKHVRIHSEELPVSVSAGESVLYFAPTQSTDTIQAAPARQNPAGTLPEP